VPTRASLSRGFHLALLVGLHMSCFAAIWTGVRVEDVALCCALFAVRMFGVTAGYHRYFSHRSFQTSRGFQLVLALLAMSSGQRGVLWWAWHHRHHHRHSDTPEDFHSPRLHGFWHAHMLWWMDEACRTPNLRKVRDLVRYPELRALERAYAVPALLTSAACYAVGGWGTFVVGFCWSTVLLWHTSFSINSLAHVWGRKDHDTEDDSRNNPLLALLMLGEGWHNNHHRYPASARSGIGPWQLDLTWLALRALAGVGLVWDLRVFPRRDADKADGDGDGSWVPGAAA
jgi:stearoyl-CoA desaturase (Delta-9 desaturase)